jgi:hypothetical protein
MSKKIDATINDYAKNAKLCLSIIDEFLRTQEITKRIT